MSRAQGVKGTVLSPTSISFSGAKAYIWRQNPKPLKFEPKAKQQHTLKTHSILYLEFSLFHLQKLSENHALSIYLPRRRPVSLVFIYYFYSFVKYRDVRNTYWLYYNKCMKGMCTPMLILHLWTQWVNI